MNKNKIIGNLYKKLLINNFNHEDIRKLLFCYNDFNSFNNFIFYLFKIATNKDNSLQHKMCNSVLSYLEYLVTINMINGFDLNILKINSFYHPIEINSFKNSVNLVSVNENLCDTYKDTVFIYKILPLEKKFYLFINNQYKGVYCSIKHINYFVDDLQTIATLLFDTSNISEYRWQEINNFIISRYWESLTLFKNNIVSLLNKNKVVDNNIYDNIYNSTNHFSCINSIISFLMWTNNKGLFNDIVELYGNYFLNYKFDISLLFDSISYVSSQELVLLSNGYEILCGDHFGIDYKNNVYICLDEIQYNDKNQLILSLFNNYDNKYFDSSINKLIFNTATNENKLYIFTKKTGNKFLYLGSFKVKGIDIGENNRPFFKLIKSLPDVNVDEQDFTTNEYINIFFKNLSTSYDYNLYSNQNELLTTSKFDISTDKMNSLLFKYNWVINKYLNSLDQHFAVAYQGFETKLILNISNIFNKNYKMVFDNKYIKSWAIANEIYNSTHNKELQSLIYMDTKLSIKEQNELIKKVLYD